MNKQQECFEFLKAIVETGGVCSVDPVTGAITFADDDSPVVVMIGKKTKPLHMYVPNMKAGEFVLLTPLREQLGVSSERKWFFSFLSSTVSGLVGGMIRRLINQVLDDKTEVDYGKLELLKGCKIDATLLKELDKITPEHLVRIHYNKRTSEACLTSDMFDEDFVKALKGVRVKSKKTICTLIEMLFGSDKLEEAYQYKAKHIAFKEADAMLNIFVDTLEALYQYVELVYDGDNKNIDVGVLRRHMEHIRAYHDASVWHTNGTVQPTETDKAAKKVNQFQSAAASPLGRITPGGRMPAAICQTVTSVARTGRIAPSGIMLAASQRIVPGGSMTSPTHKVSVQRPRIRIKL